MKFVCDACSARYHIDDRKVRGKVLRIRCKKCGNVITLQEPVRPTPRITAPQAEPAPKRIEWHYSLAGETFGPLSEDALIQRFGSGEVGDEAYVWQASFDDWKPAYDVPVFQGAIDAAKRRSRAAGVPATERLSALDVDKLELGAGADPAPFAGPVDDDDAFARTVLTDAELDRRAAKAAEAIIAQRGAGVVASAQPAASPQPAAGPPSDGEAAEGDGEAAGEAVPRDEAPDEEVAHADDAPPADSSQPAPTPSEDEIPTRELNADAIRAEATDRLEKLRAGLRAHRRPTERPETELDNLVPHALGAAAEIAPQSGAAPEPSTDDAASDDTTGAGPTEDSTLTAPGDAVATLEEQTVEVAAPATTTDEETVEVAHEDATVEVAAPVDDSAAQAGDAETETETQDAETETAETETAETAGIETGATETETAETETETETETAETAPEASATETVEGESAESSETETAAADAAAPGPETSADELDLGDIETLEVDAAKAVATPPPFTGDVASVVPAEDDADRTEETLLPGLDAVAVPAADLALPDDAFHIEAPHIEPTLDGTPGASLLLQVKEAKSQNRRIAIGAAFIVASIAIVVVLLMSKPETPTPAPVVAGPDVAEGSAEADTAPEADDSRLEVARTEAAAAAAARNQQVAMVRARRMVGRALEAAVAALPVAEIAAGTTPTDRPVRERAPEVRGGDVAAADPSAATDAAPTDTPPADARPAVDNGLGIALPTPTIGQAEESSRNQGPGGEHFAEGLRTFVQNSIVRCNQRHVTEEGALDNPRVELTLTVLPSGRVSEVDVGRDLRATAFGRCIQSHRERWLFPSFSGDAVTLEKTYVVQ